MLKIAGMLLVILGTTYYGFYLSYRQTMRIKRLKAFKGTISLLEGQIRYSYTSIPEAFLHIAEKTSDTYIKNFYQYVGNVLKKKECEDFHEAWNQGIRDYIQEIYLSEQDCEVLMGVGNLPVYLDGDMQIQVLDETQREMESLIHDCEVHIHEKCRIYKCTGFAAGVFIVLILI